jgi:hypothetical protein
MEAHRVVRRRDTRFPDMLTHGSDVFSLTCRSASRPLPSGIFLVLISVRCWVDSITTVQLEGSGQLKNQWPLSKLVLCVYNTGCSLCDSVAPSKSVGFPSRPSPVAVCLARSQRRNLMILYNWLHVAESSQETTLCALCVIRMFITLTTAFITSKLLKSTERKCDRSARVQVVAWSPVSLRTSVSWHTLCWEFDPWWVVTSDGVLCTAYVACLFIMQKS